MYIQVTKYINIWSPGICCFRKDLQQGLQKLLLLNTGLDAAYIMTGMYLKEKGLRQNSDQSTGFGNSLLLQGGFLLAFDLIQYFQHRRNSKALEQNRAGWELGTTANGVGLAYRF